MATLTCNCGETVIRFDTKTPRATVECCCDDCHARLSYCAKLGGPALEHGELKYGVIHVHDMI